MSTATLSQPNYIGKRNNFKRPSRVQSSFLDSGSDTDSLFENSPVEPPTCALCCVSSHLGQGELIRYAPSAGFDPFQRTSEPNSPQTRRSTRSGTKRALSLHSEDSLTRIGRSDIVDPSLVFESTGHVFAHHCCAAWSEGVASRVRNLLNGTTNNVILIGVDRAVFSSLRQKCSYCQNYGASVRCKVANCSSSYHYPCAVASGAFQDAESCSVLCAPEHRHQARLIDPSGCLLCSEVGELSDLLFCTTCGNHSHARCLNEGIIVTGEVRAGWQCYTCKICQQCRKSNDEAQMIICEVCDKGWHTYCLNPIMGSMPKDGWSCNNCRNCIECGNKIRNGHLIPTNAHSPQEEQLLCTNCNNHRLKTECTVCRTECLEDDAINCNECGARCHLTCDPDKTYQCPNCRPFDIAKSPQSSKSDSCFTDETSIKESVDSDMTKSTEITDIDSPRVLDIVEAAPEPMTPVTATKSSTKPSTKPSTKKPQKKGARKGTKMKKDPAASKRAKRKLIEPPLGRVFNDRDTTFDEFRCILLDDVEEDEFARRSDLCATCGAIGDRDHYESKMLFCRTCAQSYHVYCAEVTLSKTLLERGWTCPHCRICTICEETVEGKSSPTCAECYQTFHQSCLANSTTKSYLSPHWKCDECIKCATCGITNNPAKLEWQNEFSTCAPCWSRQVCFLCTKEYKEDEVLLKCGECTRWQHALHESVYTEEDADSMAEQNFRCSSCRPPKKVYKPLRVHNSKDIVIEAFNWAVDAETTKTHEKDGVAFTDQGYQIFQRELGRLIGSIRKPRTPSVKNIEPVSPTHQDVEDELAKDQSSGGEQPRKRKPYRPGIGGFLVRTRNRCTKPKPETQIIADGEIKAEPKKPQKKKKSKIIDNYPQYIQEAFFGQLAHDVKADLSIVKTEPVDNDQTTPVVVKTEPLDIIPSEIDHRERLAEYVVDDGSVILLEEDLPEQTKSPGGDDLDIFFDTTNFDKDFQIDMNKIIDDIKCEEDKDEKPTVSKKVEVKEEVKSGQSPSSRPSSSNQHVSPRVIGNGIIGPSVSHESAITSPMPSPVIYQPPQVAPQVVAQPMGSPQVVQVTQSHHGHISPQIQVRQVMASPGDQIRPRIPYQPNYMQMNNPTLQRQMGVVPMPNHIPNHVQQMQSWNGSRDQIQKGQNETSSSNRNTSEKWKEDELRGDKATISPVLYANRNHPHLKTEFPDWNDRHKQIQRLWRKVTNDKRAPFLTQARENRNKKTGNKSSSRSRTSSSNKPPKPSPPGSSEGDKSSEKDSQEQSWKQFICSSSPSSSAPSPKPPQSPSQTFSPNQSAPSTPVAQVMASPVRSPQSGPPTPINSNDPMLSHLSPESNSPMLISRRMSNDFSPGTPLTTPQSPMLPPPMSPSMEFPSPRAQAPPTPVPLRFTAAVRSSTPPSQPHPSLLNPQPPPSHPVQVPPPPVSPVNSQQPQGAPGSMVQLQIHPSQHHCDRLFDNLGRQQSGTIGREHLMSKIERKQRMRRNEENSKLIWNAQTQSSGIIYNQAPTQPIQITHRFPMPGNQPPAFQQMCATQRQQIRFIPNQGQTVRYQPPPQTVTTTPEPLKINGAVQIELKNGNSPPNGLTTCRPLNHNYSNNQTTTLTTTTTTKQPSMSEGSIPPQIPQVDGLQDSEDEPAVERSNSKPTPKTPPFVVLGPATTPPKSEKSGKEMSPKQKTIIATTKVQKPTSPGASPTNRPIRMSPGHTGGTYRTVGHSPRPISPGRPIPQSSSGATLIKLRGTQPVTLVVNSIKMNSTPTSTHKEDRSDNAQEGTTKPTTPTVELPPPPKEETLQNNDIEEAKKKVYKKLLSIAAGKTKTQQAQPQNSQPSQTKKPTPRKQPQQIRKKPDPVGTVTQSQASPRSRPKPLQSKADDKTEVPKKNKFEVLRQIQSRKSPTGGVASFGGKTADIRVQMQPTTTTTNKPNSLSTEQVHGIPIVVATPTVTTTDQTSAKEARNFGIALTAGDNVEVQKTIRSRKTRPKKLKKPKDEPKIDIQAAQAGARQSGSLIPNSLQQKLPVISEIKPSPAKEPTTESTSRPVTTTASNDEKQDLINKLMSADELTIHSPSAETSSRGTKVSEQQLKMLGISLKHPEIMSPAKSDTSSVKSGESTQPSTPTLTELTQVDPADIVKQEPVNNDGSIDKNEKESKARKRKKSLDQKPQKKRKRENDSGPYSAQSVQLGLTEAPVKINMDPCAPLGGGTLGAIAQKSSDILGSWSGHWASGGWMNNAADFYDVIKDFQKFEELPKMQQMPDLLKLSSTFGQTKSFFSVSVTDEENSSDEEAVANELSISEVGNLGSLESITPRVNLDFPVAPASPEVTEKSVFTFLDGTGDFSAVDDDRNSLSPELPMPNESPRDPVTVTLTFRPDGQSDKSNIENALKAISTIIGIKIEDYKICQSGGPPQHHRSSLPDVVPKEETRKCAKCGVHIIGEAAKKPITSKQQPDLFYCTVSCRVIDQSSKEEATKTKKVDSSTVDKKQKVHVYKRRNYRISLAELIDLDLGLFSDKLSDITPQKMTSRGRRQVSETQLANFGRTLKHKNTFWNIWNQKFVPPLKSVPLDMPHRLELLADFCEQQFGHTDKRTCVLCKGQGDGKAEALGRLLNVGVSRWVHVNCILWSMDVREDASGALINVPQSLARCQPMPCTGCGSFGASVSCNRQRCDAFYHVACAQRAGGAFLHHRQFFCSSHAPKAPPEPLKVLTCCRRLFIDGDEIEKLSASISGGELRSRLLLRVGSLKVARLGRICPEMQLLTSELDGRLAPLGMCWSKMFWTSPKTRKDYHFQIEKSKNGRPSFSIKVDSASTNVTLDSSLSSVFDPIGVTFPKRVITVACFILNFHVPQLKRILENLPWVKFLGRRVRTCPKLAPALAPEAKRHCPAVKDVSNETNVYLQASPIHQIGLFSAKDFDRGQVITQFQGTVFNLQMHHQVEQQNNLKRVFTIRVGSSGDFVFGSSSESACRYVNHSRCPNCEFRTVTPGGSPSDLPEEALPKLVLTAARLVKKDEELTVNYCSYSIDGFKQNFFFPASS